eukprot:TRINITY_DN102212_c0_g1_i1.p1 TRINITY_DN102212_c0_g1~~TRINITY_DN102212_c0_g1_i1.p1  ORF type:complete len:436 (-),score=57.16 TRINITY_DN102212_c0_g1_i1:133-1359(-)
MVAGFTAALGILFILPSCADPLWLDVGTDASVSAFGVAELAQDEDECLGWQRLKCSINMLQVRGSTLTQSTNERKELPRLVYAREAGKEWPRETAKPSLSKTSENAAAARIQVARQRNAESCPQEITSPQVLIEFGVRSNSLPKHAKVRMCEMPTGHGGGILYVEGLFDPAELKAVQQYLSPKLHNDDDSFFWQQHKYYEYFMEGGEIGGPIGSLSGRLILDRLVNLTGRAKPGTFQAAKDAGYTSLDGVHQAGCVHHDRNLSPGRTMTVLAYIEAPVRGGHTAFPTVRAPGRSDLHPLAKEAASSLPVSGQPWSDSLKLCYASDALSPATRAQNAACEHLRQADDRNTSYNEFFGIAPVPGDAVVFKHFLPRTSVVSIPQAEWNHFHNGCAALGPRSKVAVQYFAEG